MSAPMAIRAQFADWRTVKSRKSLQLIFEAPMEQQGDVLALLGAPMPDRDLWVGIARIAEKSAEGAFKGGENARRAGILAQEGGFQRFAGVDDADAAADFIRARCGVESRRLLDHDERARNAFKDLAAEYGAWLKGAGE